MNNIMYGGVLFGRMRLTGDYICGLCSQIITNGSKAIFCHGGTKLHTYCYAEADKGYCMRCFKTPKFCPCFQAFLNDKPFPVIHRDSFKERSYYFDENGIKKIL